MFSAARVAMRNEMQKKGTSPLHSPQASPLSTNRKSMMGMRREEGGSCVGAPAKPVPAYLQVPAPGETRARDPTGDGLLTAFWALLGMDLPLYEAKWAPAYIKDKVFLRTGFRLNYSWPQLWASLFHVHNESCNVWTHLPGAVFFLGYALKLFLERDEWNNKTDLGMIILFDAAAGLCCLFSSIFHHFGCRSYDVYNSLVSIDFAGIVVLIYASSVSMIHFAFYCHPSTAWMYIGVMSTLAVPVSVIPFIHAFRDSKYRKFRTFSFVFFAFTGVAPMVHIVLRVASWEIASVMGTYLVMGLTYLTGVWFYLNAFPEAFYIGSRDFSFSIHSHAIWHLFVLTAAYWHHKATFQFHDYHLAQGSCPDHTLMELGME